VVAAIITPMPGHSDPEPLRLDVPLRQSWDIRRRRHEDRRMLVRHNQVYQLSEIADQVWCNTIDGRTFVEIIAAVAAQRPEDRAAVVAAATTALEDLITMEFVMMADRGDASPG
jgi:hypothetical protein